MHSQSRQMDPVGLAMAFHLTLHASTTMLVVKHWGTYRTLAAIEDHSQLFVTEAL